VQRGDRQIEHALWDEVVFIAGEAEQIVKV
jgi:hypothetical protein